MLLIAQYLFSSIDGLHVCALLEMFLFLLLQVDLTALLVGKIVSSPLHANISALVLYKTGTPRALEISNSRVLTLIHNSS